ncbi:WSC domain-containing protein 1-like isoform X2 [Amphibalanus amphitrite]|uniref:WSC domain-containing protein 1-like isoform X2 n=1 Tax=Amphibalanus amphitrite TaxID=1232801 RepID=UPI001C91A6A4|nr:WSC domain-containing protein 1-like isoform X2 [Amphibalanus amphitrite]
MVAVRRLPRDLRRLLPLAFLIGCSLLSIIYVRSYRQGWPVSQPYHTRKVGSIDEQRGSSAEEGIQTAKGTAKSQHGSNRAAPEASTSGDGEVRVRLQQQPVRWPWEGVEGCSQYGIRFAERGTLPIVALSSYPGSGNTWTRYMLELASGVFTGSIYYDMGLYSIGYWGELSSPEEGTTIVQKVHDFGDDQVQRFNRTAIVIVRNPYRAVLSFHNYLFGGHKGMAPSSNYLRKGWRTFVMKQVFEWSAHVQKWTEPGNRVLVVHYEHLKSDPVGQLRRMLKFLNWPIDEERLKCVQEDADGVAHRHPPHFPADVEPFPDDVREIVEHGVGYVNQLLRRRGHPPLPLDRYSRSSGERLEECYAEEDFPSCLARVDAMNPPAPAPSFLARATDLFSRLLGDPLRVNLRSGLGTASAPPALEDVPGAAALRADWNVFEMSRQEL